MLSTLKAGFIHGENFQFGKLEECEVNGGRVPITLDLPPHPCPQRFAGTQRPRGKSPASQHRTGHRFSAHRAKELPRKAGATFTLRGSTRQPAATASPASRAVVAGAKCGLSALVASRRKVHFIFGRLVTEVYLL